MAKVQLRATGGLNYDIDENNIPEGDYIRANNIVFDTGKSGGAGAIKMLESITATGVTFAGTIKATTQDPLGIIYVLVRTSSTVSTIFKLNDTQTVSSSILTYSHGVTTDFVPDLRVLGDTLVWNYCGDGIVLTFPLSRYTGTSVNYSIDDLTLQKKTPNGIVTLKKNLQVGFGLAILENNDFQFAYRYKYDSGQFSVLSANTQIYKAEKDTISYTFKYNFSTTPTFVTELETYAKIGNSGTWRRIDSRPKSDTSDYVWGGQLYETLDLVTSSKPFDAVPVMAKHVEVAKNRIFLANIQDDYLTTDANKKIAITSSTESALGAGSSSMYGYTNVSATSTESSYDGSGYVKPFANNSTYAVGWAYYDESMKTRGIERFSRITTGNFAYPFIPNITLTKEDGYVQPSWAKYIQLLYTKNTTKSYIYEGYASNVFFELKKVETDAITGATTETTALSQSITKDNLKDINYFVVDLMGMFTAGRIYIFQKGDKISIRTVSGATATILEMDIVQQKDNYIYCKYNGAEMECDVIPDPSKLYFEIYTPKQTQEEESLVFYEYGNLIPMPTNFTSLTFSGASTFANNKLIGDMVFSTINLPTYKGSPFLYTSEKATPIDDNTVADRITIVNGTTKVNTTMMQSSATQGNYIATDRIDGVMFTGFGASNQDVATIPSGGGSVKITGYYESGRQTPAVNLLTFAWSFSISDSMTLQPVIPPSTAEKYGTTNWRLLGQIYRIPYDNKNKKKLPAEKFGSEILLGQGGKSTVGTTTNTASSSYPIDLNKNGVDINANDEFSVELKMSFSSNGDILFATSTLSNFAFTTTLNGDRTAPKTVTTYNPDSEINTNKSSLIIRSISNAVSNQQWNTSSGKPALAAKDVISLVRTNAIRYSGNYVSGTKVNNLNSFFALDSNEVPIENGDIMSLQRASRLQGNGAMILALCKRESAYIFLGEQELTQGNNASIRALTANFIGTIRNMGGMLGLQEKGSVMNHKGTIWWWDNFNKKIVKYDDSGIDLPSNLYVKSHFQSKDAFARLNYDPYYNMCMVSFQSETKCIGYSETLKRWVSEFNYTTEFAESYGDKMILFRNGIVYKSLQDSNKTSYNSLMGTSYNSDIQFVLNTGLPVLPWNIAIQHNCNIIDWTTANFVKANLLNILITNENGQSTPINESNLLLEDNRVYAHVLRDTNSTGGIIEGNYMVGYLNKFLLSLTDKTQNMRIVSLDVELERVTGHS
jgi:hypothetical protein